MWWVHVKRTQWTVAALVESPVSTVPELYKNDRGVTTACGCEWTQNEVNLTFAPGRRCIYNSLKRLANIDGFVELWRWPMNSGQYHWMSYDVITTIRCSFAVTDGRVPTKQQYEGCMNFCEDSCSVEWMKMMVSAWYQRYQITPAVSRCFSTCRYGHHFDWWRNPGKSVPGSNINQRVSG